VSAELVAPLRPQSRAGRHIFNRLNVVWALVFLNVLNYTKVLTIIPIPSRLGQALTQGSLEAALVVALTINPRRVIKPNLFMGIFTVIAGASLIMSFRLIGFGPEYRAVRLVLFVLVLWLVTPFWSGGNLTLARAHLRVLTFTTVLIAVGMIISHHKAFQYAGRLGGALWPIQPPGAAHISAIATGMTLILWMCGLITRRRALTLVAIGATVVILTHTRTALLAMVIGVLIAGASLLIRQRRVRIAFTSLLVLLVLAGPVMAPGATHWLERGQSAQGLTSLTGRTSAWKLLLSTPRPETEKLLGTGITNDSIDGLPIDNSWLATYQNEGLVGDILIGALLLALVVACALSPPGPARAMALFLVVYCIISSFTETGIGAASLYMLDLTVAASLVIGTWRSGSSLEAG